ncbi:hypothetical protein ACMFMG_006527 [Clarireedia jacksonii]
MKLPQLRPLFASFSLLPLLHLSASPALALEFHSPENEQILIAGTKFDIGWAPHGGETKRTANLTLMHMLSASSIGGAFLQIATNVPIGSGKYSWIVPTAAGLDINNVHFPPWAVMARWMEGEGEEAKEQEEALSGAFWVNEVRFWERDGVVITAADGGLDKTSADDGGGTSTSSAAGSSTSTKSVSAPEATAATTTAENSSSSGSGSLSTEKEVGVSTTSTISSTDRGASTTATSSAGSGISSTLSITSTNTASSFPSSSSSFSYSSPSSASSSLSASTSSSSTPAPAPAAPNTKRNETPMIIGISLGILSLILLIGSFLFFRYKHKRTYAGSSLSSLSPSHTYSSRKLHPLKLISRHKRSSEKDAVELQTLANVREMEGVGVEKFEIDGSTSASHEELPQELDGRCVMRGQGVGLGVGVAERVKEVYGEDGAIGRMKVLRGKEEKSLRVLKREIAVGLPGEGG